MAKHSQPILREVRELVSTSQQEHKETHRWLQKVFAGLERAKSEAGDVALERYLANLAVFGDLFSGEQVKRTPLPGVLPQLRCVLQELETRAEEPDARLDPAASEQAAQRMTDFKAAMEALNELPVDKSLHDKLTAMPEAEQAKLEATIAVWRIKRKYSARVKGYEGLEDEEEIAARLPKRKKASHGCFKLVPREGQGPLPVPVSLTGPLLL